MGNVEDITRAVCEYVGTDDAGQAIGICSPWGGGKTHVWQNTIAPAVQELLRKEMGVKACIAGRSTVYVSLFGVSHADQIHAQILAQSYGLVGELVRQTHAFLGPLLQRGVRVDATKWLPALLNAKLSRGLVLCFDDVERAQMKPTECLGCINRFVEHACVKVVVLYDEGRLWEVEGVKPMWEKVVGHRYELTQDSGDVLRSLVQSARVPDAIRVKVSQQKDVILDLFGKGGAGNYRVLRQAVLALARVLTALRDEDVPQRVFQDLVMTVVPLAIEKGLNRLDNEKIRSLCNDDPAIIAASLDKMEGAPEQWTHVIETVKRYGLEVTLIGDEARYRPIPAVGELITKGFADQQAICRGVKSLYAPPDDETRIEQRCRMGSLGEFTDQQFTDFMAEVNRGVSEGRFARLETWWHAFCKVDVYRHLGLIDETLEAVLNRFQTGVRKAIASGVLPTMDAFDVRGAVHYTFDESNAEREKEFARFLEETLSEGHGKAAANRFREMWQNDRAGAIRLFNDDPYGDVPLEELVPASDFVQAVVEGDAPEVHLLHHFLHMRFDRQRRGRIMPQDCAWLHTVCHGIDHWLDGKSAVGKPSILLARWMLKRGKEVLSETREE